MKVMKVNREEAERAVNTHRVVWDLQVKLQSHRLLRRVQRHHNVRADCASCSGSLVWRRRRNRPDRRPPCGTGSAPGSQPIVCTCTLLAHTTVTFSLNKKHWFIGSCSGFGTIFVVCLRDTIWYQQKKVTCNTRFLEQRNMHSLHNNWFL